jgi:PPOX class probable F420-dependent enzyme
MPDATTAARLDRFLATEPIVWISSVRPDGMPHLIPIWFSWDGVSLIVLSKPHAQKVRNLRSNPKVMVAIGNPEEDFDVVLVEAKATLESEPAQTLPAAHRRKYRDRMAAIGLTPDDFVATYSQVVRITPTRALGWHGRTLPRSARPSLGSRIAHAIANALRSGTPRLSGAAS